MRFQIENVHATMGTPVIGRHRISFSEGRADIALCLSKIRKAVSGCLQRAGHCFIEVMKTGVMGSHVDC